MGRMEEEEEEKEEKEEEENSLCFQWPCLNRVDFGCLPRRFALVGPRVAVSNELVAVFCFFLLLLFQLQLIISSSLSSLFQLFAPLWVYRFLFIYLFKIAAPAAPAAAAVVVVVVVVV